MRRPRQHAGKHLDFIRGLPCLICMDNTATEAAHVRSASRRLGKRHVGLGEKADDCWTVPLCGVHHRLQHKVGEYKFWEKVRVNPHIVSLALWAATGDQGRGEQIVRENSDAAFK